MARHTHRLTDIKVRSLKAEGLYADGDGLYARVTTSGTRGWIFRFKLFDRMRDMGLGTHPSVSLAEARKLPAKHEPSCVVASIRSRRARSRARLPQ
jgi:hypothetical protein